MNRFNSLTKPLMWFMALLTVAFVAGCGGGSSSGGSSNGTATSSAKAITAFSLAWTTGTTPGTAKGIIDETLMKTISVTVPYGTNLTPMYASFITSGASVTVGSVTQVNGTTPNDFSNPVAYKVTAADGTWATYTVLVTRNQKVSSIAITPTTASIPVGITQQFTATATYLDMSTADVTPTASWTSSASGVASVGSFDTVGTPGLATGIAANVTPVDITATFGGQKATAAMTVTNAALMSLAITPASGVVAAGSTFQFAAIGTYTDGTHPVVTTTASWTPDASNNATVGLHTGLATGVTTSATPVVITATKIDSVYGSVSATADLTVTAAAAPVVCTGAANCVDLKTSANYAIFGKAGVTNVPTSATTGNVGTAAAASTITGYPLTPDATNVFSTTPEVTGKVYAVDYASPTPNDVGTASTDMGNAYTNANLITGGAACPGSGNFGGLIIAPGVYTCSTAVNIATNVTLAGTGAATDVWVFQISGTLTQSSGAKVILTNALPQNVFWAVASTVQIGTTAQMEGVVLGQTDINVLAGATVNGRLLAQTLVNLAGGTNTVTKP